MVEIQLNTNVLLGLFSDPGCYGDGNISLANKVVDALEYVTNWTYAGGE